MFRPRQHRAENLVGAPGRPPTYKSRNYLPMNLLLLFLFVCLYHEHLRALGGHITLRLDVARVRHAVCSVCDSYLGHFLRVLVVPTLAESQAAVGLNLVKCRGDSCIFSFCLLFPDLMQIPGLKVQLLLHKPTLSHWCSNPVQRTYAHTHRERHVHARKTYKV